MIPTKLATLPEQVTAIHTQSTVAEDLIEQTMRAIKGAKKPLPAWAFEMALRAYDTYKTYKNGQKVEEVRREVLSVLKIVTEVKDLVEAGHAMSEREYRLTRELLDEHGRRLDDLTVRVVVLERHVFRRGCGVGHAWRNGRCVDVAANPR